MARARGPRTSTGHGRDTGKFSKCKSLILLALPWDSNPCFRRERAKEVLRAQAGFASFVGPLHVVGSPSKRARAGGGRGKLQAPETPARPDPSKVIISNFKGLRGLPAATGDPHNPLQTLPK